MYENTGKKIKDFAKLVVFCEIFFFVIVALALFVGGVIFLNSNADMGISVLLFVASFVIGVVGSVLSWLKYLFLAGYGELIEETAKTSAHLEDIKNILKPSDNENNNNSSERNEKILTCNEKLVCSYCGSKSDFLISRLCSDCHELLGNGIILECPICKRFYHKSNKCNCQAMPNRRRG